LTIAGVAIGGAIGSVLRYLVHIQCINWFGTKFPYGTLVVNSIGSLLVGFLSLVLLERFIVSPEVRFAVLIGLLGGFTTFSTFSMETINLLQQGNYLSATSNIVFNIVFCLTACFLGVFLARII
jgi:CrcB protein